MLTKVTLKALNTNNEKKFLECKLKLKDYVCYHIIYIGGVDICRKRIVS